MEVIFKGKQSAEESIQALSSVMRLFKERHGIYGFSEMRLSFKMQDSEGLDVELIDNKTSEIYKLFEVFRTNKPQKSPPALTRSRSHLRLAVNNAR